MEFWRVQQAVAARNTRTCQNETLDTQVHPAQGGLLNTSRLTCARVRGGHLRIVSTLVNSLGGDFLLGHSCQTRAKCPLNPETVSGHTVAGTWVARLRAMLLLGHARTSTLTGQQMKENVSALMFNCGSAATRNQPRVIAESEYCGFLSLSHFMGWRLLLTPQGLPYFFLGGAFCFLLFLFVLISPSQSFFQTCTLVVCFNSMRIL